MSAIDYLTGYLMAFGAMVALARRAREGGSWLVRISLAQTGRWLVGRGQVPEAELKDVPKEFTPAELERWTTASDTPVGRLHHLGPVVQPLRDAAALGPALGAARLPRAGVASADPVTTPGSGAVVYPNSFVSACAFSSQNRMSISWYIVVAVVRCSRASSRSSVRR